MTLVESPRKEFVLVVDSDCHRARALATRLRALGYYAASFACGEDALKYAAENEPDAIVSDWSLSDMQGLELARRAKTQSFATKVILLSDQADWRALRETLECGGEDVVARSVSMEHLQSILGRTLEAHRSSGIRRSLVASH